MAAIKHPFQGRSGDDGRDVGYDYRRTVGRYIRDRREEAGLTQRDLGNLVGLGNNAISAIELGRNPIPPERYRAFAKAFGFGEGKTRDFGKFLLEYTDPWLHALIYGDSGKHDAIPERIGVRDGQ